VGLATGFIVARTNVDCQIRFKSGGSPPGASVYLMDTT